jgi:hypothetical protein
MPYRWTFDIRNTVPDYQQGGKLDTPAVEHFYDHVNAMCFLLDGVPYKTAYGPAKGLAEVMLNKLRSCAMDAPRILGTGLVTELTTNLARVQQEPGSENVELRWYYENVATAAPELGVVSHFLAVRTYDRSHDNLLCMPFVDVQEGAPPIPVNDMDTHIQRIGAYTLFDIYTKSHVRFGALSAAVAHGKSIGAFGMLYHRTHPGLYNNRKCNSNGCVENFDTWCNIDSNGNCTTGS